MIKQSIQWITLASALITIGWSCSKSDERDLGFGYVRRGEHVHFVGGGRTGLFSTRIDDPSQDNVDGFAQALGRKLRVCKSPDANTFEALSEEYSRDKNMVFYKWISPGRFLVVELPDADVATFKVLNFVHSVDKNAIWYLDQRITGSDPASAKLLNNRVVKDSKRVYVSGEAQDHLDATTFRCVGSDYYIDARGVYWGTERVTGADIDTFKVLGDSFIAVDNTNVYRSGERQPNLDATTCKLIQDDPYGYQVVSDKNGVYVNNLKFLYADPNDFTMIDPRTAKGGNYAFLVDTWHCTPLTLYKADGRLIVETVLYARNTKGLGLAVIKAEVAGDTLKNITFAAPPGKEVPDDVPQWQIDIFQREDLVERMTKARDLLK